jgi:hypothetical protein
MNISSYLKLNKSSPLHKNSVSEYFSESAYRSYWLLDFVHFLLFKNTLKHNIPETGRISVIRRRMQTPTVLRLLGRANLNLLPHVKAETDPVSETPCFLVSF